YTLDGCADLHRKFPGTLSNCRERQRAQQDTARNGANGFSHSAVTLKRSARFKNRRRAVNPVSIRILTLSVLGLQKTALKRNRPKGRSRNQAPNLEELRAN